MKLEEGAGRAPFLLTDEEDEEFVAVASASVALSRLTIVPSVPPDAVSGDWTLGGVGGGHLTSLAASPRASCSRGGGSISSALTDVPLLASFSPFTGGGVWGGVWWRKSRSQWCDDVESLDRPACTR